MRKSRTAGPIIFILGLFVFQNCSRFSAFEPSEFYGFSQKPEYFSDLQMVSQDVRPDQTQYTFDFVVSDAENPTLPVTYKLIFSTNNGSEVCLPKEGEVNNQNNHVTVRCQAPSQVDSLTVELRASSRGRRDASIYFSF